MKKYFLILILSFVFTMSYAQKTTEQRLQEIEDRLALKALVDEFSVLADKKDIAAQMQLFTEDAKVESVSNGQSTVLSGKKQIGDAFGGFLSLFEVVYHINGQQTVTITGDKASGIAYCSVSLIGMQNGKRMKNDMGVIYNDEYVKVNGKWLIAKRKSNFTWSNSQAMN